MRKTSVLLISLLASMLLLSATAIAGYRFWHKLTDGQGEAVGMNPLNPNTIYSQSTDSRLMVSRNGGSTWSYLGFAPYQTREILVHPRDTLRIFVVAFSGGLYKSTDGGNSFGIVPSMLNYGIDGVSVEVDPSHPDTMYAGNFADAYVFRSTDRGDTWTQQGRASSGNLCTIAVRPDSGNILYCGSGSGRISKSVDSGLTWRQVKPGGSTEIPRIVIDRQHPLIAYACAFVSGNPADLGVWKTTDGGETWGHTSLVNTDMWALDIDDNHPDTVYAGTFSDQSAGVYQTTNGGTTWTLYDQGFVQFSSMWNMRIDQQNPSNVYVAATNGSFGFYGTFKLIDGDAGVQGFVRDSLTGDIITNGIVQLSPSGDNMDLSYSGGGFKFFRPAYDSLTPYSSIVMINGQPYPSQAISFVKDSIVTQDILVRRGSIEGLVYDDVNNNGVKDGGESGLGNKIVVLSGAASRTVSTDSTGHYVFGNLLYGNYTVSTRPQWDKNTPTPAGYPVSVAPGVLSFSSRDFGVHSQPRVVSVSPPPFTYNNGFLPSIQVSFPSAMNTSTFNDSTSFVVQGSLSGRHQGAITFNGPNTVATFTPSDSFSYGEQVTVDISSNLHLLSGESIGPYIFQFATGSQPSQLAFTTGRNYSVGLQPWAVVPGDLDKDGKNDLVVANYASNSVSVLKNLGFGVYSSRVDYGTLGGPRVLALGDLNNDGWLDIVVGGTPSKVSVFLNNRDGTFGTRADYNVGGTVNTVSLADVDGEGSLDVITTSTSNDNSYVLLNNGAGVFGAATGRPSGFSPWGASAADINNDGGIDLVAANSVSPGTVTTMLNGGGGELDILSSYSTGVYPRGIAAVPVTSDQSPDIVAVNSLDNTVSVFSNDGGGHFSGRVDYDCGNSPWGLASGDLDGDGHPDLATANILGNSVTLLRNNGSGGFDSSITLPAQTNTRLVAIADVDGDGKLDVVASNTSSNTITVFSTTFVLSSVRYGGWNMISLPVVVSNKLKTSVYPGAISSAFSYQGGYVTRDTLQPGVGYWLKFPGAGAFLYTGTALMADTVQLRAGWNMIGGLSVPVRKESVITVPSGIVHSNYYRYAGGYVMTDTIFPGLGCWVKVTQAGSFILRSAGASTSPKASGSDPLATLNSLEIRDNEGRKQTLYFSGNERIKNSLEMYELPPSPPQGIFDVRFVSGRMLEYVDGAGSARYPLQLSAVAYPLVLKWNIKESAAGWGLVAGANETHLTGEGSVTIGKSGQLMLQYRDAGTIAVPTVFSLSQNYPNPFNPTTSLHYEVSSPAVVMITVYDVLGRTISNIVSEQLTRGAYSTTWNANNAAAGVYYVAMNAVDENGRQVFHDMKKMLLIR